MASSLYRSFTSPNRSTRSGKILGATLFNLFASCRAIRLIKTTRHVKAACAKFGWFVDANLARTESKMRGTASDYMRKLKMGNTSTSFRLRYDLRVVRDSIFLSTSETLARR